MNPFPSFCVPLSSPVLKVFDIPPKSTQNVRNVSSSNFVYITQIPIDHKKGEKQPTDGL